jgi:hypothetical protein
MWSRGTLPCGGRLSQIRKDRAIRAVITVAVIGQVLEHLRHRLQFINLRLQFSDMRERHRLDVGASAVTVAPQDQ